MNDSNTCFQQLQTIKNELTRLTALVNSYNPEKIQLDNVQNEKNKIQLDNVQNEKNKIQLKNDYDNAYNIYLKKKKEYDNADDDYKLYLQNGRDWRIQQGQEGLWNDDSCMNACNSKQSAYPEGGAGYSISFDRGWDYFNPWRCMCSLPNPEIVKNKFNIKNQKKIESDNALAENISKKNIYEALLKKYNIVT
jgi:hypothetical protein